MEYAFYLVKHTLLVIIDVLDLAMLLRAILSWIMRGEENGFTAFLYALTEPVIHPIRQLFYKLNWFQETPLDMPFLFAVLLLMVARTLLGAA